MLYVSLYNLQPTTATQVQPQQPANKCVRHKTFHQRVQLQTAATATATATTTTTTTARKVMAKHLEIKQSQCVFKSPPPYTTQTTNREGKKSQLHNVLRD